MQYRQIDLLDLVTYVSMIDGENKSILDCHMSLN